ncbi:MAG: hydantoinase B/oxoprolinase family protein [Sulfolobales archaeon]
MVSWEIIARATIYITEEMGVALKRSAFSPNIRERMDHSCAIVDERGRIIAQAEHIPVHLGSFRVGVANLLKWIDKENIVLEKGDMVLVNDPYISGTHLNDLMLLAPIYYNNKLVGYAVNKAHHVDVGGPVPGSMNPEAKTIYEEGVIIPPIKLLKKGSVDREIMRLLAENFKNPRIAVGDLSAQIAANIRGIEMITSLINKYGLTTVAEAWSRAIDYSKQLSLKYISEWPRGVYEAEDYLEYGDKDLVIRARVEILSEKIKIDFTGSSENIQAPVNAVYGVTFSASSFAIRALMGKEVFVNEGFYELLEVIAPEGTILNPKKPLPVSGGNVETSQRIVDVIFKALAKALPDKVPAAGSGTMMNVMIGGLRRDGSYWSYYETIGGGTGARPGKNGVSGVHVNMTNTLNTPIEIAERSYPLLYTRYMIREGSGGEGLYRGGDGIVRSFILLEGSAKLSVLAERFRHSPWGLWGGGSGAPGKVRIRRSSGEVIEMPSKFSIEIYEGDEVIIETPGGGGIGSEINKILSKKSPRL